MTEGLYESFAIPGTDVVVPNGTYAGWESQIVFFTDQSRPVALNTRFNWAHSSRAASAPRPPT
ncbi:MAG: hypothetical protein OXI83_02470 [Gemmatimonadota bacterium]|nr:hypothetical protein [Gemmatimonadota bacterium]